MSSYVCAFMDLTVMLVAVRTYLTMVGFVSRDPHALTLVAASMLMAHVYGINGNGLTGF